MLFRVASIAALKLKKPFFQIKYQTTYIGMLFDTLGFVFSSIGVMILSKTRLVLKCGCCTASYNDHTTDITKDDDDHKEEKVIESYVTLPPPLQQHLRKVKNLQIYK